MSLAALVLQDEIKKHAEVSGFPANEVHEVKTIISPETENLK